MKINYPQFLLSTTLMAKLFVVESSVLIMLRSLSYQNNFLIVLIMMNNKIKLIINYKIKLIKSYINQVVQMEEDGLSLEN